MKALELFAEVDEQHRLQVVLPPDAPRGGRVRVLVLLPEAADGINNRTDRTDEWTRAVAHAWASELDDEREDVYSLSDGGPADATQ